MKKRTAMFLDHKVIGLMALTLGIHLLVSHYNKVFPFGFGSANNELMFIWAYVGPFIGMVVVTYGLLQLFHKTYTKLIKKLECGEI